MKFNNMKRNIGGLQSLNVHTCPSLFALFFPLVFLSSSFRPSLSVFIKRQRQKMK